MTSVVRIIKSIGLGLLIVPLLSLGHNAIYAAESATDEVPIQPNGYTYNEATGLWENEHYTWDPTTHRVSPKDKPGYSYNPLTGRWDTDKWAYDPNADKYVTNTPADPSKGITTPTAATASQNPTPTAATSQAALGSGPAHADSTFNGFYDSSISNKINASATSGNAGVINNTSGGNATTGNASTIETIFNLLQSSAPTGDLSKVATFTTNIDGNVLGDLYIDPHVLSSLQPAQTSGTGSNVQVNLATNNAINNDISASAATGDANVSNNTTAGNAASGNANAVVNLVNLLNSSIAAGQSFLGILNINGNLNGDILLPPGTLNSLISANSKSAQDNLAVSAADVQKINNVIQATAASGTASVADNTAAGNAASGGANTKINVLNLTGHEVVGSDSLLVFVNVLGKWVGAIVDAPAGSTAAALGGNLTDNRSFDTEINSTNASQINNNVLVDARSGDASVNHNTTAGDAITGSASASANITNISNSTLSLGDWFGILFINVFGAWEGSFGIDTAAGTLPTPAAAQPTSTGGSGGGAPAVFRFMPHASGPRPSSARRSTAIQPIVGSIVQHIDPVDQNKQNNGAVLGVSNSGGDNHTTTSLLRPTQRDVNMAVSAVILGAVLVGIERVLAHRDHRNLKKRQDAAK